MVGEQKKLKVLIVDDNPDMCDFLGNAIVSRLGKYMEVHSASNVQGAYSTVHDYKDRGEQIHLLCTNILMPIESGDMLLERLLKDNIYIPTLVITGITARADLSMDNKNIAKLARAINFAHEMYDEKQRIALHMPSKEKVSALTSNLLGKIQQGDYNELFTTLIKPVDYSLILGRTSAILENIYGRKL